MTRCFAVTVFPSLLLLSTAVIDGMCGLAVAAEGTASVTLGPLVQKYCVHCHGKETTEAAINLDGPYQQIDLLKKRSVWNRVLDQLESESMPPEEPYPSAAEFESMKSQIKTSINDVDWNQVHHPGRMGLARLTTAEYENSVRDIFGVDLQAGAFLGKDPEGNTGFSNDRDSLTFPLFAFDNFMREAEQVVDAYLSFERTPWSQSIDTVTAWKAGSDGSVGLTDDGKAVLLKERNAPYQLNLDLPFSGMYRIRFRARTVNGEPISATNITINGKSVARIVITDETRSVSEGPATEVVDLVKDPSQKSAKRGGLTTSTTDESQSFAGASGYSIIQNLPAGANVLSFGYDPDRAPIIQREFTPRPVPSSIADEVLKPRVKKLPLPDSLRSDREAVKAWKNLNNAIRDFSLTQRLAEHLVSSGRVDYEQHGLAKNKTPATFGSSKTPINLTAGKVAVFLKIPQAELEEQIKKETGFSHEAYRKSVNRYKAAWREKYPQRVPRIPGSIALSQVTIESHALGPQDSDPASMLSEAKQSVAATRQLIHLLGTRAYGRDMQTEEVDQFMRLYQATQSETGSHREGLRDALVGLLVSPPFLLRYDLPEEARSVSEGPATDVVDLVKDPRQKSTKRGGLTTSTTKGGMSLADASGYEGTISGHDVAERLSRFLWLSIPDEQLRNLAAQNQWSDSAVMKECVDRMIESPKFDLMAKIFVEQWLDLESLSELENSRKIKAHTVIAMKKEPALLFADVFRNNRSLFALVDPDFTYLNDSLAHHYGIEGVEGQAMRPVELPDDRRGGLLAMGGILTATSTPNRTSPVTRGAFIVELLLGEELPPPPPNVPELERDNKSRTIREQLELHRQSSACAGCHSRIDPFGFVLEHYDQFGAWRDKDRGKPVSAATKLVDGTQVDGLSEFKKYVVHQRRQDFVRNLTERMFEFAIGRKATYSDEAMIRQIMERLEKHDYEARTLIYEIAMSDAFQKQAD